MILDNVFIGEANGRAPCVGRLEHGGAEEGGERFEDRRHIGTNGGGRLGGSRRS